MAHCFYIMYIIKHILISFLLTLSIECFSQRYFNELIDYNTQNNEAFSSVIQLKDSSFFSVGFSYDFFSGTGYHYYSTNINNLGQKIGEKYIVQPLLESQGMAVKKINDNTLIVCGGINDLDTNGGITRTNRDMYLLKVNNSGDTLWTRRYSLGTGTKTNPDFEIANDIIISSDSGFVLVGLTSNTPGNNWQIYLVKVNSNGTLKWQKTFGGSSTDMAYSIIETADKGFLLAGYTLSYGAGGRDGYLIKTDSLGNFQWQKTYGGSMTDGTTGICKSLEGGYLLSGWTRTNSGFVNQASPWLIKIDINGNQQWSKTYGCNIGFGEIDHLVQLQDSSYICVGVIKDSLNFPTSGLIMKVKVNGDSLWAREYKRSIGQDDYFNGFCATNDGGFIMAGQVSQNGTPSNTQDAWLVKTDCLGGDSITHYFGNSCYMGGLSLVNEVNKFENDFLVYPNPVKDKINISSTAYKTEELKVIIVDVLGKEILFERSISNGEDQTFNLGNLDKGIYFVKIYSQAQLIVTKKIIKE